MKNILVFPYRPGATMSPIVPREPVETFTTEDLVARYGLLMTIDEVAEVFKCKKTSLRALMSANKGLGALLRGLGFKMSNTKRIYFHTEKIADVINEKRKREAA